jgi:hypothetical protein
MTRSRTEDTPRTKTLLTLLAVLVLMRTAGAGIVASPLPTTQQISVDLSDDAGEKGVSGLQLKNRKTVSALARTMSKVMQLESTARGLDPNGNKGKNRKRICSLEHRVQRLLINVQKGISKGVLSGNLSNAVGRELVIAAEEASQWATQISGELFCTPGRS